MILMEYLTPLAERIKSRWPEYTARTALLILAALMTYVVLLPQYNFAHFIPRNFLEALGMSYAAQLWLEQHSDAALHFVGAAALVILLTFSALWPGVQQARFAFTAVILLCILAELAQLLIGRGFDEYDLLFGISGSFMAYLAVRPRCKHAR